jgi:hypothetical protein
MTLRFFAVVVMVAWVGCDEGANSSHDLSAPDLAELCPGLDPIRQTGSCMPGVGAGWFEGVCFPDHLTYCTCASGKWECCGDMAPECPATPPSSGESCCPSGSPASLTCAFDGGASCTCGLDFRWSC